MNFLSWAIMILMVTGLGMFKIWEYSYKSGSAKNDVANKGLQMLIEEYYASNFAGKVLKLLFFGAFTFSTIISVIRGDFKDE